MKIATWNVNSLRVRLAHVEQFLQYAKPDVLCVQETKVTDPLFPEKEINAMGYSVFYCGEKTYNGVAILAKYPLTEVETCFPADTDPSRRLLAATCAGVRVINVYVPNGAAVGTEKYSYKLAWLSRLKNYLSDALVCYKNVVVLGDFNIAPSDIDVHDPLAWQGNVLVSEPEREALREIMALGFVDSFRSLYPERQDFSWWDYRAAAFRRNQGLRIDHILMSRSFFKQCRACDIDKQPRTWERPSDHTPVMVDLDHACT